MGQNTWETLFLPTSRPGGLAAVNSSTNKRLFDNFESPATTATIAADWTGTNVTVTRETAAPLHGEGSMKIVVAGGAGSVYKTLDHGKYGYPFPGHNNVRIRYVRFRATVNTGTETIRVTFGDASDANHYRYWTFSVIADKYRDFIIDMDLDNTEGYPDPTEGSTTFDPEIIDRFGFTNLTTGKTFYIDEIEFFYEYSLQDTIGFGTEAPVGIGDEGSVHARLNSIQADVKSLEGQTTQYAKQGIAVAEIGQALQWALELNSDFAPPTTTEIEPGNYQIDQIRGAVNTNIVGSSAASEAAGSIYASYTPPEATWNPGDLVKVTFSGGYIRSDESPTAALTGNVIATDTSMPVANAYAFQVGWTVRIYDDATPAGEYATISAIGDATHITLDAGLAGGYTTVQNAAITRVIRTDLSTAVFFTMLQTEAQSYKILARGTLTTSSTSVPADTSRTEDDNYWNGKRLMPITGDVANQSVRITDFANAGGVFTVDPEQLFTAAPGLVEYIIIEAADALVPAADSANNITPAHVIGNKSDTIPAMNLAPGATDSLVQHAKAILERLGATPADSDDSALTNIGQRDDAATNDDMSDISTTSMQAKLRLILNRLSSDAFTATIQGSARTELDAMLAQLATYLSASGAAWSVQVNGQLARTNLEQTIEDILTVVGIDGANVFDPAMFGGSQTTVESAFAGIGTALGAEYDGSPDVYDTIVTGHDSTAITANADGSVEERLEHAFDMITSLLRQNPLEKFWEPWQDEVAGIDTNWWATAVGGTGTAARDTTEAGVLKVALECPAGTDTSRLRSVQRWRVDPANFRANSNIKKLVFQFRSKAANIANIDNASAIIGGFTPGTTDTRATNNIAAFVLNADLITSVTDNAGTETTNDLSAGLDFTSYLLFKIEVYRDGANNTIKFTVTDAAGTSNTATHTTNIPAQSMYLNFYNISEAAVASSMYVGEIDCSYYDNVLA